MLVVISRRLPVEGWSTIFRRSPRGDKVRAAWTDALAKTALVRLGWLVYAAGSHAVNAWTGRATKLSGSCLARGITHTAFQRLGLGTELCSTPCTRSSLLADMRPPVSTTHAVPCVVIGLPKGIDLHWLEADHMPGLLNRAMLKTQIKGHVLQGRSFQHGAPFDMHCDTSCATASVHLQ